MKVAILGAGKLGIRITEALLDGDYDITLVDTNEDKLNALSQQYDVMTVTGDAKTVELLRQINVSTFDFLFSCTTSDDTNILAASFAKSLGCPKVAARVRDPEHMSQMDFICDHMNIDLLVNPDTLITSEIYRYLIEKYTLSNGIYTSKNIGLIEFEASRFPQIVGLNLIKFREIMPNMIIVAISRGGKLIIPHGNDVINPGDLIYLMGNKQDVFSLARTVHTRLRSSDARKVMIIGGGKTGYYLARRLAEYGSQVKIVEKDKKRCHYLSEHLRNVMVLNGDGADISLLEEENFEEMEIYDSVPEKADFGVYIDGDSMEPRFHDEELVWIEQTDSLQPGEIGLFFLDGMTYIKKYVVNQSGTFLVSLNARYKPKEVKEYSSFRIFGRVATDG